MSVPPVNGSEDLPSSEGRADESPGPPLRRVPNLAHALLFVSLAGLVLVLFELLASALGRFPATAEGAIHHPKLQIAIEASAYVATVLISSLFFPALWHRPFAIGLSWRWPAARGQAARLVGLGLMLGIMMQLVTSFVTPPKTMPIDEFFATAGDAWLITFFGTLVAPAFEEICFRGFLLPAFAIAYDWLSLPRTDGARTLWQTTTNLSTDGLLFSAILSSVLFAWMHAPQVAHLWAALLGLFSISLVLSWVRVKTESVAASAMVHASYNGFVFLVTLIATGGYRHLERMTR